MDKIKQWTITVSMVSVISGILLSFVPKGKMKAAYKTLVSIALVYSFLLPLIDTKSIDFNIEDYLSDNYEVSENYDKYAIQSVVSSAEKAIEDMLSEFADSKKIDCRFSVKCEIVKDRIAVASIGVVGTADSAAKEKIIAHIDELGFNKDIIEFKGEIDEQ